MLALALPLILGSGAPVFGADEVAAPTSQPAIHVAHDGLKKLSWQLAIPTGTFMDRTVFETIELLHGLDVHHLELTPGQGLSPERRDVMADHAMSTEDVEALLAKLKSVRMDIVSYGPVDLGSDDNASRPVFAFAKFLKVKNIIASPAEEDLERLDELATEYGVNLALYGKHPKDTYATADAIEKALVGRSQHVGAYLDIGHPPLNGDFADGVRLLKNHVIQIRATYDGPVNLAATLAELRKQGFKGVVTAACEPGKGSTVVDHLTTSVNALSDAITKVAE